MGKVLIVDDDEVSTKLYKNKLESDGHAVAYARDGKVATELLADTYDLIILDVMIPNSDGITLLKKAKSSTNKHTPVLVYTNLLDEQVKENALEAGAEAVLFKADFTPFTFIDTLYTYL